LTRFAPDGILPAFDERLSPSCGGNMELQQKPDFEKVFNGSRRGGGARFSTARW